MRDRVVVKFIRELGNIKDPAVFLGVARILEVGIMEDKDTPKDFSEVLNGVIENFIAAPSKRQKELLGILKDANKCKESIGYGNNTEDSAETVSNEEV